MPFHGGFLRLVRRQGRQIRSLGTRSTLKLGPRFATRGGLHRVAMRKLNPTPTPTPRPKKKK